MLAPNIINVYFDTVLNNQNKELEGAEQYAPVEVIDALRAHNWHISADEQV